ncbi:MAG: c-type cytochrome [Pirellulaceae bacterium]|nr:c-type cytochrome [Pirellulaceae bacterium]
MTCACTTIQCRWSVVVAAVWASLGLVAAPGTVRAQETAQFYRQNCASCHTIGGGRLTGPDLKDVTKRQNRDWLVNFILNPTAVLNSGDAYALKLKDESRGAVMPAIPGMTRDRADALLQLIEAESALDESQFKGIVVSTEPFTEQEIELGRRYVLGTARLANGGAACIGCHSVHGTGSLGGGRLGPDLTRVYQRLGGDAPRKNLTAWLTAPATATMAPVFRSHPLTKEEINGLVAFFEHSAQSDIESNASGSLAFLLLGVFVAVCGLVGMDAIWRNRFRSVRRALVWASRKTASGGQAASQ